MIRKIREITFQGTNYLSCKAHNFENQLLITINDTINNNNNNNYYYYYCYCNKRVYPNPRSGQRALAFIGWFERAVIVCGGTKAQKQQSHRLNSGCWTGVLVTLIGRLCRTDPYSFMKEHVISIEEVSC